LTYQEALDYIRSEGAYRGRVPNGPLLLLLDINMPRVDGVEVLRRLKATGISIIFITHKLHEALSLGDEISILRHGRLAGWGRFVGR